MAGRVPLSNRRLDGLCRRGGIDRCDGYVAWLPVDRAMPLRGKDVDALRPARYISRAMIASTNLRSRIARITLPIL